MTVESERHTLRIYGRQMRIAVFAAIWLVGCSSSDESSREPIPGSAAGTDAGVADVATPDSAAPKDASTPEPPDAAKAGCGDASVTTYTCSADGTSRQKCAAGELVSEPCARGCLRNEGKDATCMGKDSSWSCTGEYGKTKAQNGDYYVSAFGCWVDEGGHEHTDPGDNCVPSCLEQAKAAGLCKAGESGRQCEERLNWYTADAARFGCLARLRVTNPANGKSVVAVALDYGPGCAVEADVSKAVLDTSGRIDQFLFGGDQGASDRSLVHVVEVDPSTPLGP